MARPGPRTTPPVAAAESPATTTPTTLAAAPPPDPAVAPPRTSCTDVIHIGDSTSVGMISPTLLPDADLRLGAQYARVGVLDARLEISGARSTLETMPGQVNARDTAAAARKAGFAGCWVFALGTTDTANVAAGAGMDRRARIERMMAVAGDDPVLWVTLKTLVSRGAWSNTHMQEWNAALAEAEASHPSMRVYDWASVVQDEWFDRDRIHYTSQGAAFRARSIADALAAAFPA